RSTSSSAGRSAAWSRTTGSAPAGCASRSTRRSGDTSAVPGLPGGDDRTGSSTPSWSTSPGPPRGRHAQVHSNSEDTHMADDSDFTAPCSETKDGVRCIVPAHFADGTPIEHEHRFPSVLTRDQIDLTETYG